MIRFDHVTFGYEAERPVLRELSLEIPEGGRVCLTGASGQGKTTALRLLLGLEQPQSGRVIRPEGTRFSVVFQEDRLLPWKRRWKCRADRQRRGRPLLADRAGAGRQP